MLSDLKTLYHLTLKPIRGPDHAARLESFYAGQAEAYDRFRDRLLPGRGELYASIPVPEGGVWVDLGGGTGANFEFLGSALCKLNKAYLVDLSPSLLAVAERRIARCAWKNVETVCGDATTFRLPDGQADVVTFSYSLTMIPDWFAAIENASRLLKPGGLIGAVDFYVSRKHPGEGMVRHGWATRTFWPIWFGCDSIFPSSDHLPMLQRQFELLELAEQRARVPYLPLVWVPYYTFVGRKRRE